MTNREKQLRNKYPVAFALAESVCKVLNECRLQDPRLPEWSYRVVARPDGIEFSGTVTMGDLIGRSTYASTMLELQERTVAAMVSFLKRRLTPQ
jgi:hypothetical protein